VAGEALVLQRLARRAGLSLRAFVVRLVGDRRGRLRLGGGSAFVVLLVVVATPPAPAAPHVATLSFLDVGEGAATLIQVPNGPTGSSTRGPVRSASSCAHVRRVDLLRPARTCHHIIAPGRGRPSPIAAAVLPQPPRPSRARRVERL
jgi:hypothetical protein